MSSLGRRLVAFAAACALVGVVAPSAARADGRVFTGIGVTRDGQGYALVSEAGEVYAYGSVGYRGNAVGFTGKIADISVTADGSGYALISTAGQVYAFGTVVYRGNPAGFSGQIVDISVTGDGLGYVAISSTGQVYAYGTAVYHGNPTGFSGSMAAISVRPDGQGYVAMSSAGQVYAYNVVYRGNPAGFSGSMVDISVTNSGQGYLAMSSVGQMYAFNVVYRGNPTGFTGSMAGVGVTGDGQGYGAVSSSGQVYAYGSVVYRGNGDPGQPTATGSYRFVLPRSSIATEYWLTKPHHDYPASDIPVPTGTPYYAITGGTLTQTSATGSCGLGYILAGDDGVTYTYCHGSSRLHGSGARVTPGQHLGYTGNTGNSSGPHLHFQVRFGALRCPQNLLLALYRGAVPPDPKTLPTSGCTY